MAQAREDLSLGEKAAARACRQALVDELQRDDLLEGAVGAFGAVDGAHAAAPEQPEHAVRPHAVRRHVQRRARGVQHVARRTSRRGIGVGAAEKRARVVCRGEQALHFSAQRGVWRAVGVGAGLGEKGEACGRVEVERLFKEGFHALPAVGRHSV